MFGFSLIRTKLLEAFRKHARELVDSLEEARKGLQGKIKTGNEMAPSLRKAKAEIAKLSIILSRITMFWISSCKFY
jgi:hypothetical protein